MTDSALRRPAPPVEMVCATCGSTDVQADAYAAWDVASQQWQVVETFDKGAVCADCDGPCRIVARPLAAPPASPACGLSQEAAA